MKNEAHRKKGKHGQDRPRPSRSADAPATERSQLAHEFDELLQPRRSATEGRVERIAAGCVAFVGEALSNPAWGALVARGVLSMPNIA
jgi:hypothetical protein